MVVSVKAGRCADHSHTDGWFGRSCRPPPTACEILRDMYAMSVQA